jgi:hypothetical protein
VLREPFGGNITHHCMPPNTVAAHVAYLCWAGLPPKIGPALLVCIGIPIVAVLEL